MGIRPKGLSLVPRESKVWKLVCITTSQLYIKLSKNERNIMANKNNNVTKNPYWREDLRKEIENVLPVYDSTSKYILKPEEITSVLKKMYSLFVNDIADIRTDLTNIHDSILEINRQMGIKYNPKNL